jgi:hypothetical protein
MTNTDALKSMLNNLINDKPEEATLDLHNYLTAKMKDVAGIGGTEDPVLADPELETPAGEDPTEVTDPAAA